MTNKNERKKRATSRRLEINMKLKQLIKLKENIDCESLI